MQAAVGVEQLKKLPEFIETRKKNWKILYEVVQRYEDYFVVPKATNNSDPSWFGFLLTVKEGVSFSKNDIVNYLEKHKVATRPLFAGNILRHPAYQGIKHRIYGTLTNTDYLTENVFWIGVYPGLDEEKINYVIDVFESFMKQYSL
jgi:CDP-6-deoxy-D-xylo-4-hexulose-3-dehydrase